MRIINRRQNKILNEIVDEQYKVVLAYAKAFDVSEQTIRNDIKEINDFLKPRKQPVIQIDDGGRIFTEQFQKIEENVIAALATESNYYSYKLSQEERKTILAMALLNAEDTITIAKLSDMVFMSRNTLISDLDELKKWFDLNEMKLVSQPRKGFTVTGTEKSIRKGMLKLLLLNGESEGHNNDDTNDIFKLLLIQELDKINYISTIKALIKQVEEKNCIYLTDYSFSEFVYELLILTIRLLKNKTIEPEKKHDWNRLKQSSKYQIAIDIESHLILQFGLRLPLGELANVIETLRTKRYIKNNGRSNDMFDIQILINEFIYKVSEKLNINYYLDFFLYDLLIDHMRLVVHRLKQNNYLKNPLLTQLHQAYPEVFDIVKENITSLEEYIKHDFDPDEISFIVMYIVAVMEKNKSRDMEVKAIIVCNTGRGTAQLISAKLQSLSRQIKIVNILSAHNLTAEEEKKADMIISTIPLKNTELPYVFVNAIMSENDLTKIQLMSMKIQDEKQKTGLRQSIETSDKKEETIQEIGDTFSNMLLKDGILLDEYANDWQEAVALAGKLLLNANVIKEQYIAAMIENIEKNGPYVVIYPGIAIPHALPEDGAISTGAAIVRLKHTVCFHHEEHDPVKYIIALSIQESDHVGKKLYNLTKLLRTGLFSKNADQAKNESELIQLIRKMEQDIKAVK